MSVSKGFAKISNASQGNESYNEDYEESDGDGGTRKVIGPSEIGYAQDFTDNGGQSKR